MIAHRLQTIESATNLIYLLDKETQLSGVKGTPEYKDIMDKLQRENYAH